MKYSMGLDIGIASVGWAVLNLDKNRIEDLGVRLFSAAERPKDGGAINENRRLARGLRRRINRKRIRMNKIKELFVKYELITKNELDNLYILSKDDIDTWQLRAEALDRKLTNREWARVLTTIAKRRGYKSNRKTESNSEEGGKILKSIALNKAYMESKGYRTIGEMFAKDEKFLNNKRNKYGEYNNCIERKELEEEVKILFEKQKEYGNNYTMESFEKEYLQVFNYQKPFMTKELMEKMIGKCTFEKQESRASKNSWTFERFMLLQRMNNLSYQVNGNKIYLSEEERKRIIELAYSLKSGIKYQKIRNELNLPDEAIFTGLDYYYKRKKGETELPSAEEIKKKAEDKIFVVLKGYHEIEKYLEKVLSEKELKEILDNISLLDDIAEILTKNKTDVEIVSELEKLGLKTEVINALLNINFTNYGHLSHKALSKILPYLEEGYQYDKACELAGYNFKNDEYNPKYKLPVISKEDIRNPVVYRAITQTRKVINAIIDKYGSPFEIHIEVARELTKNFKDRTKITKQQEDNKKDNDKFKKELEEEFNIKAKQVDMLKMKLYKEQDCKSIYSLKPIELDRLFENGYVEIDHAIPFSRSFDNSYNNKVLVLSKENQEKRNMTPYEYLGNTAKWEEFEAFVKSIYKNNPKKRDNILVKNYDTDKENEWIKRNIVDTQYIARYMSNFIKQNLLFNDCRRKRK